MSAVRFAGGAFSCAWARARAGGFLLLAMLAAIGVAAVGAHDVSASVAAFDVAVKSDGATHAWRLDELSGSTAFDSVGAKDLGGAPPAWQVAGPRGGLSPAARFVPGQSLTVSGTGSQFPTATFSAEAWFWTKGVNVACTTTVQQIVGLNNFMRGGADGWGLALSASGGGGCGPAMRLTLTASLVDLVGPVSVSLNAWHHVVVTRAAGTWALYLDGALVGTSTAGSANPGGQFWVGQDQAGAAFYLDGRVSRVGYYASALSAGQVLAHYELGAGVVPSLPAEQTDGVLCGGGSEGTVGEAPCSTSADPVNTLTGAFVHRETDAILAGTGVPFDFTRTYASSEATSGRFGPAWTDNFAASVTVQPTGDALVRGEEGQELWYTLLPDGTFAGAPGARASLAAVGGGYQLTTNDQTVYEFDSSGRLLSIKDLNGKGLTLTYDASNPDRLLTVATSSGDTGTLGYNASGLVSSLTLSDGRTVSYAYTSGRLTSVTDVRGKSWTYQYDAGGRLEKIIDPLGHAQVTNVYDAATGRITSQTDATSRTTLFAWDPTTQTATITDPSGHVWKDVYENFILVKKIDGTGKTAQLGHDGDLNATTITSTGGEATTQTFDADGNVLTQTGPPSLGSPQKTYTYNALDEVVTVTDPRGKVTSYTYDGSGNVLTVTQDGVLIWTYTYDASGRMATSTDANSSTTSYSYDSDGNVASITGPDPDGPGPLGNPITSFTYDSQGNMLSETSPKGNVVGCGCAAQYTTVFTYDPAGQQLTETDAQGHVSTSTYDDAGRLSTITDANGHTTSYTYDNADRVLTVTAPDPDGAGPLLAPVTSYTYDSAGNKSTETDPRGNTTTYTYDNANRLAAITGADPDGAGPLVAPITTFAYDAEGNIASLVDPRGNAAGANPNDFRSQYGSDAAGQVKTVTSPLGHQTAYHYDMTGQVDTVTDANGRQTTYTHDAAGRILTATAPDPDGPGPLTAPTTTFTYDAIGNRLTQTDAKGHVTTTAYDAMSRPISITGPDPDGAGPLTASVTSYVYDLNGNLLSETDANGNGTPAAGDGVTSYGYDNLDRLTSIDYADATPDVAFTYDNVGNRLTMTDGSGTETRTYDNLDRPLTIARAGNTMSYAYDAAGNVTKKTYPDGTVVNLSYDGLNRLTTVATGTLTTTYAYDPASNLITTTLPGANGYVETRIYDKTGRLTTVKNAKGATTLAQVVYALDPVGNPLTATRTGSFPTTQTYTYDNLNRLTGVCFQTGTCPGASDPFIRWTYDAVGNRQTEQRPAGATTYTYDNANRLLSAGTTTYTYDRNGNELTAGTRTFTYDLENRLRTTTASSTTTTYSYDGDGLRLQASTGTTAAAKTNFLWDISGALPQPILERNGSNALLRRYINGQRPIFMSTTATNAFYFHYNPLGSILNVTSSTGATQLTYEYEPFGTLRSSVGTSPTNLLKFTGQYQDPTNLYFLRARQYDPTTGRFLSTDPAGQTTGDQVISGYAYAGLHPTTMIDPSGAVFLPANPGPGVDRRVVSSVPTPINYTREHDEITNQIAGVIRRVGALDHRDIFRPSVTTSKVDNELPGASAKNPANSGYADIILWAPTVRKALIWEVKAVGQGRKAAGDQLLRYRIAFERNHRGWTASGGLPVPGFGEMTVYHTQGVAKVFADTRGTVGLEWYRREKTQRRDPGDVPDVEVDPKWIAALIALLAARGIDCGCPTPVTR